jgi:hypothetical protein
LWYQREEREQKRRALVDQLLAAYLDEVKTLKPRGVMQWLTRHGELWTDNARWPDPIKQVEKMIACWELQRAGHLEEYTSRLLKIGRCAGAVFPDTR